LNTFIAPLAEKLGLSGVFNSSVFNFVYTIELQNIDDETYD
jgi:hypothetical protein